MITVLEYLVIAAAIGAVVFVLAVFVFGRGEQMAPLDPRTSPAQLPESGVSAADLRAVRFSLAVRGYRMSDVDWTLERVGDELEELRRENAELRILAGRTLAPVGSGAGGTEREFASSALGEEIAWELGLLRAADEQQQQPGDQLSTSPDHETRPPTADRPAELRTDEIPVVEAPAPHRGTGFEPETAPPPSRERP